MSKRLYVSSDVQKSLLTAVLIPQMKDGFWKNHRPADHATQWLDVEIIVTDHENLGPIDFKVPRLYNFVNPEFIKPNEDILIAAAQAAKASSNFRSVKKELIELSRIVGGRLNDKNSVPLKANRGNNKAAAQTSEIIQTARDAIAKASNSVKRTAVKRINEPNVSTFKTSAGATVRHIAVVKV